MPKSNWLKADTQGAPVGVDREGNVLRGYVVAQEGPFKSEGRGEFDLKSLKSVRQLMASNKGGTKVRFGHPTLSADGIGTFLGRAHNPTMSTVKGNVNAVRADLHFDKTALDDMPNGGKPLGNYVMDLAESDPDALSSSLVLMKVDEYRLDSKGRRKMNEEGYELPPLWRPTDIHASDLVDTGDAVDGLLSASLSTDGLRDGDVRAVCEMLDRKFAKLSRDELRAKVDEYLSRYLAYRFSEGDDDVERRRRVKLRLAKFQNSLTPA